MLCTYSGDVNNTKNDIILLLRNHCNIDKYAINNNETEIQLIFSYGRINHIITYYFDEYGIIRYPHGCNE